MPRFGGRHLRTRTWQMYMRLPRCQAARRASCKTGRKASGCQPHCRVRTTGSRCCPTTRTRAGPPPRTRGASRRAKLWRGALLLEALGVIFRGLSGFPESKAATRWCHIIETATLEVPNRRWLENCVETSPGGWQRCFVCPLLADAAARQASHGALGD